MNRSGFAFNPNQGGVMNQMPRTHFSQREVGFRGFDVDFKKQLFGMCGVVGIDTLAYFSQPTAYWIVAAANSSQYVVPR